MRISDWSSDVCSSDLLADEAGKNVWDIGLIGAEPQRAEKIAFSAAYVEIESTYLVPAGSPLKTIADVDAKGVRIVSTARAAYDLWLERNIKNAELVRTNSIDEAFERFTADGLEALAGLNARLLDRKRVGGGKSVEVSVGPGVARNHKQKNK